MRARKRMRFLLSAGCVYNVMLTSAFCSPLVRACVCATHRTRSMRRLLFKRPVETLFKKRRMNTARAVARMTKASVQRVRASGMQNARSSILSKRKMPCIQSRSRRTTQKARLWGCLAACQKRLEQRRKETRKREVERRRVSSTENRLNRAKVPPRILRTSRWWRWPRQDPCRCARFVATLVAASIMWLI